MSVAPARKLKIGIVGCGGIAREHVKAYRRHGSAEIAWVYDVCRTAAETLAAECGAQVAPSIQWLAEQGGLDAASICSPPGVHVQACLPLLEARVAVLCEKPLAATLEQARQLAAAVQQAGSLFMVAYCHRFHPPVIKLKQLIDAGVLGRPVLFLCNFSGQLDIVHNHRGNLSLSGGGCLMDNGAHAIDLLRYLFGEPTAVQAVISNAAQRGGVEDVSAMQLCVGEAVAQIVNSYSTPGAANRLEWVGDRGTAVIQYFQSDVPELMYRTSDRAAWTTVDCSGLPHRVTAEIAHFLDCIQTTNQPLVGIDDGLRVNEMLEQAYQAAQRRAVTPAAEAAAPFTSTISQPRTVEMDGRP